MSQACGNCRKSWFDRNRKRNQSAVSHKLFRRNDQRESDKETVYKTSDILVYIEI